MTIIIGDFEGIATHLKHIKAAKFGEPMKTEALAVNIARELEEQGYDTLIHRKGKGKNATYQVYRSGGKIVVPPHEIARVGFEPYGSVLSDETTAKQTMSSLRSVGYEVFAEVHGAGKEKRFVIYRSMRKELGKFGARPGNITAFRPGIIQRPSNPVPFKPGIIPRPAPAPIPTKTTFTPGIIQRPVIRITVPDQKPFGVIPRPANPVPSHGTIRPNVRGRFGAGKKKTAAKKTGRK